MIALPVIWDDNTRYALIVLTSGDNGTFTIDFGVAFTDANRKVVTNDYRMEQIWKIGTWVRMEKVHQSYVGGRINGRRCRDEGDSAGDVHGGVPG